MKLKEYLPSLIKMARLKRLDPAALNEPTPRDVPVIVSCTSIPSRFRVLDKTVRSVLNQTKPPKKMILWLHERHQGTLPPSLTRMEGKKFEIHYTELDSPHCKLVPTLLAHPQETIVTCDDDLMYEPNWLETLWESHQAHPGEVITHIGRNLAYTETGEILPYLDWKTERTPGASNPRLVPMGWGGVLYPPGCLHGDATNVELYSKLAPKADDLWFKAMSAINGTSSRKADTPVPPPYPMPNSQAVSLKKTNVKQDGNRTQWQALEKHYPELYRL